MNDETKRTELCNNNFRILVVDDEPFNMMACKCVFRGAGMKNVDKLVFTALNGELAVQIIKEEIDKFKTSRYNLIFMDLNMPVLDGCSASSQIRELIYQKGLIQPLIIGNSGQIEREYIERAFESGMNCMLSKPINIVLVKSILEKMKYI